MITATEIGIRRQHARYEHHVERGTGRTTRHLQECACRLSTGHSTIFVCATWREVDYAMAICADVVGLRVLRTVHAATLPDAQPWPTLIRFTSLDADPHMLRSIQAPLEFDHHAALALFDLPLHKLNQWHELEYLQERFRYAR
uniref:Uncharacterized protein n=1 Tax=Dinoroseobacter phage vB_DshS_R26L TaxID=3161158 RepID=A0AAU7VG99_9CAUD